MPCGVFALCGLASALGGGGRVRGKAGNWLGPTFFFFFFVELGELRCPATGAKKSLQNRSLQPKGEIMFFFKTKL
jgi:hypothetical protein